MEGKGIEEEPVFEIGIVVTKRVENGGNGNGDDCIEVLSVELKKMGLIVDRVVGVQNEFLRVSSILFLPFLNIMFGFYSYCSIHITILKKIYMQLIS